MNTIKLIQDADGSWTIEVATEFASGGAYLGDPLTVQTTPMDETEYTFKLDDTAARALALVSRLAVPLPSDI